MDLGHGGLTRRALRCGSRSGRPQSSVRAASLRSRRGGRFLARWVIAIAVSMTVAGVVEYAFAAHQLEQRIVEESVTRQLADLSGLEQVLGADLALAARAGAISHELEDLAALHGTRLVALFDSDGSPLGVAGQDEETGREEESVDPQKVLSVVSSQRTVTGVEEG